MHSSRINGEGELRGQPANPGSPGKIAVNGVCMFFLITGSHVLKCRMVRQRQWSYQRMKRMIQMTALVAMKQVTCQFNLVCVALLQLVVKSCTHKHSSPQKLTHITPVSCLCCTKDFYQDQWSTTKATCVERKTYMIKRLTTALFHPFCNIVNVITYHRWDIGGQFTCPNGNLSKTDRHRVRACNRNIETSNSDCWCQNMHVTLYEYMIRHITLSLVHIVLKHLAY